MEKPDPYRGRAAEEDLLSEVRFLYFYTPNRLKQLGTILFLSIAVFYLGGYRLLTTCLRHQANTELEQRLDRCQYKASELVSIKTPLNLPYYTSSPTFEPATGELLIKGVVYKYIKRRVYHDTLEVLCIRDGKLTGLQQAKDNLYAFGNGLAVHPKKPVSASVAKPLFFPYCNSFHLHTFLSVQGQLTHASFYSHACCTPAGRVAEEPPET